ncbi:MAG: YjjG family noncanonical pyrimidine nucleotidase [Bacilli bacterium]
MRYQILLFDADETLFDFKASEKQALQRTMTELHFPYEELVHLPIYESINARVWEEFAAGTLPQPQINETRFTRYAEALGTTIPITSFSERYMHHLSEASILYPESEQLVRDLAAHHTLYIVTNGLTKVQEGRIKQSTIAHYFEDIIVSEEIGVAKPHVGIFEHTLRLHHDVPKSAILMIGDSLSSDVQGGLNYGIDTCWYNPKGQCNHTPYKPTYEINALQQLHSIAKKEVSHV